MSGAVHFHSSAYSRAAVARLGPALAASALMHLALLAVPPPGSPWRGVASHAGAAPMTVRLAPAPVLVLDVPAEKWGQGRISASASQGQKIDPGPIFTASASQQGQKVESDPIFLPQAPDLNYYPARDLDDYPRPLAPLRVDRPAHAGAGEVRLELLIDERGVVRDVVFAGPARPGAEEEELRAALAATPFAPARKDGRPVRSRILLSFTGTHTFSVPRNFREDDAH